MRKQIKCFKQWAAEETPPRARTQRHTQPSGSKGRPGQVYSELLSNTVEQRSQTHQLKKRRKVALVPASLHPPSCHFSAPRATVPAGRVPFTSEGRTGRVTSLTTFRGTMGRPHFGFTPPRAAKLRGMGTAGWGQGGKQGPPVAASGGSGGSHSDLLPSNPAGVPTEAASGCAKQSPADSTSFCHRYSCSLIPAARVPPSSPAPWDLSKGIEYICPHQSLNTVSIAAFFMIGSNGDTLRR